MYTNGILTLQIKLPIHLAMGRVGLCLRPPKMGPAARVCSGGFGERSAFVVLGQSQAGIKSCWTLLSINLLWWDMDQFFMCYHVSILILCKIVFHGLIVHYKLQFICKVLLFWLISLIIFIHIEHRECTWFRRTASSKGWTELHIQCWRW